MLHVLTSFKAQVLPQCSLSPRLKILGQEHTNVGWLSYLLWNLWCDQWVDSIILKHCCFHCERGELMDIWEEKERFRERKWCWGYNQLMSTLGEGRRYFFFFYQLAKWLLLFSSLHILLIMYITLKIRWVFVDLRILTKTYSKYLLNLQNK